MRVLDPKAGFLELRREPGRLVAAVVVDGPIDRAVEPLVGGDQEQEPPSRSQGGMKPAEGAPIVLDVLEDVETEDGVDPPSGERLGIEGHEIERLHLHSRVPLEGVVEDAEIARIDVGRHDELAADQVAGEAPDPGADLEDPLPQPGGQLLEHPAVVPLGPRQPEERLVAGVGVLLVVDERVAQDRPEGDDAVRPADLLAFPVRPAGVGDRHLVDARVHLRQLRGELRLHAESARPDRDALDDVRAEDLVAGLHVGEVQVRDHVREEGQELVRDVMPEIEDAARRAGEAGAVHDVGLALEDRGQELRVVARVVLEVRVLDQHDVSGRLGEAAPERGALALVGLLVEDPDLVLLVRRPESPRLGELGLEPAEVVSSAVLGAIVDDDDLLRNRGRLDALENLGEREPLVVDGDDDREPWGGNGSHRGIIARRDPGPRVDDRGPCRVRRRERVALTRQPGAL